MAGNIPNPNMLLGQKMLDLLYARDVFSGSGFEIVEGSFSNARAIAQLRQYYMRMVDSNDQMKYITHWDQQRRNYIETIETEANYKDSSG